jgi:hypothetical protein
VPPGQAGLGEIVRFEHAWTGPAIIAIIYYGTVRVPPVSDTQNQQGLPPDREQGYRAGQA